MKTLDEIMSNHAALDSWDNYVGSRDMAEWFVFLGQHRESDALSRSNFIVGLQKLGGESKTVQIRNVGHWAVGWIEEIMIDPVDTVAVAKAEQMLKALDGYPVLDEDHFSELEWTENHATEGECYSENLDCPCGNKKP